MGAAAPAAQPDHHDPSTIFLDLAFAGQRLPFRLSGIPVGHVPSWIVSGMLTAVAALSAWQLRVLDRPEVREWFAARRGERIAGPAPLPDARPERIPG